MIEENQIIDLVVDISSEFKDHVRSPEAPTR